MVSDFFLHNTCSYIDLLGLASFDPKGLIGRIYVGDYLTLLNIKYRICGPNDFRIRFSKFLPSYGSFIFPPT